MKFFQNQNKAKGSQSKKCNHHKHSFQYVRSMDISSQKPERFHQREFKNFTQISNKSKDKITNPHNQMIKSLVAMNQQYFQDKLQVQSHGKPCKLKLKIPSATGPTIYKKDYIKLSAKQLKNLTVQNFKESKISSDFFGNTTYRNQFAGQQNSQRNFCKKTQEHTDSQAPAFLNSEYKHNFLNWGTGSHMPSMKPFPSPAVTNLPLHPNTIYSSQFTKKPALRHKNTKLNHSSSQSCLSLKAKQVVTPLLYLTTNNIFYDQKKNSREANLKPKTQTLAVGENNFKGKTEYQSEFKSSIVSSLPLKQKKPLSQLQNLIVNL